ncbi:MAG: methyltransferase [Chlorobi bacterium]|nr:methyltransferase [Chlorobiota bacterium]
MRIIRGQLKGRKIFPPKGFDARPTTDFAKESLFNILGNIYDFGNADILDLFSGSGNISMEFLSEGCKSITAVELNRRYAEHIKKQFAEMFPGKGSVICADVFRFCKKRDLHYDIIFADPPFKDKRIAVLPDLIFSNPGIKDDLLFVLEHPKYFDFSGHEFFKEHRKYGNIHFSFFEKK